MLTLGSDDRGGGNNSVHRVSAKPGGETEKNGRRFPPLGIKCSQGAQQGLNLFKSPSFSSLSNLYQQNHGVIYLRCHKENQKQNNFELV